MSILPIVLLAVLIGMVGVATFIVWKHWRKEVGLPLGKTSKKTKKAVTSELSPLEILKHRLVKGEITKKTFLENKKLIEG